MGGNDVHIINNMRNMLKENAEQCVNLGELMISPKCAHDIQFQIYLKFDDFYPNFVLESA